MLEFGNEYKLIWIKKPLNNNLGYVANYTKDYSKHRRIPIVLVPDFEVKTKHRFVCMQESESGPMILGSVEFFDLAIEMKEAAIWHEVGHIHNCHFHDKGPEFSPNKYRMNFLNNNTVAPEEIEADEFALTKVSKLSVLKFLDFLLETRIDLMEKSNYAVKELELRIQLINNLNTMANYYFAYGSNLSIVQMNVRCPESKVVGIARLDNFKWIINKRGYANIVDSQADYVEGVIYSISKADEFALDKYEGVPNSYKKYIKDVIFDNSIIKCLVYIDPITELGRPKKDYVERLLTGKNDSKLNDDFYSKYWKCFVD